MRIRVLGVLGPLLRRAYFRGGIETRGSRERQSGVSDAKAQISVARRLLRELISVNACVSTLCFHLRRRKFSIIWQPVQMRRTQSTAFFIGGSSTLTSENGRRKLRRPSLSSSNKVFSNKSDLRMEMYFTTSRRVTSPLFSRDHHRTLLLMMTRDEIHRLATQAQLRRGGQGVAAILASLLKQHQII